MKKLVIKICLLLSVFGILCSCASTMKSPESNTKATGPVIGAVQTVFFATGGNNFFPVTESIKQQAYIKLKEVAEKKYQGNIDVINITVLHKNWQSYLPFEGEYSAEGQVILVGSTTPRAAENTGVEGALTKAAEQTLKNVPQGSAIAIVYITAPDRSTTDYIAGELEYIWVNEGYKIIDRSQLDRLRREQNLQMSGEVDDETAVSIGKFAGANIIVTGRVDGEGDLRRLRLRALDTQTAQVIGVSSERL